MPYLLLTLASIFWGGNYVVGHVLVSDVNPYILSLLRWGGSFLLLFAFYHRAVFNDFRLILRNLPVIFILSVFGQLMFPLCLYIGLQYTNPLNAAMYLATTPCIVLLINRFIFNDRISLNHIIGVILSLVGVIYLLIKGDIHHLDSLKNLNHGDLWAMIAALSWALYCSILRKKDKRITGGAFVTTCAFIGMVLLVPICFIFVDAGDKTSLSLYTSGSFIIGLLYIIIFPSWLSYYFWGKGIAEIGATRGEIYTHVIPLSGGIMSIIFLHVSVDKSYLVSAILIILGIYFCSKYVKNDL